MKIEIPKVVLAAPMGEYAPELQGKNLYVWVNPPRERLQAYDELVTSLQERELEKARETLAPDEPKDAKGTEDKGLGRVFEQVKRMLSVKRQTSDGIDVKLLQWYAEIWSQGIDADTHWSVDELRELEERDPSFLSWMIAKTWETRNEHLARKKKV